MLLEYLNTENTFHRHFRHTLNILNQRKNEQEVNLKMHRELNNYFVTNITLKICYNILIAKTFLTWTKTYSTEKL